jgi:hypothetical protein
MLKLLISGSVTAILCATTAAQAGTYIVEQSQSRYISCYQRVYVPAKIEVNTRGVLVRPPSKAWEVGGDTWAYVRNPPVYIETQRVVEPDHFTLVSSGCPVAGFGVAP